MAPAFPIANSQAQPWKPAYELERAAENRDCSAEPSLLACLGACVFVREPFQSRHWDESLCISSFLWNSPRKKAVAGSGKQERKGKKQSKCEISGQAPGSAWFFGSLFIVQSCPALCNPRACSPPGSSVHGIVQKRKPEWVAMFFSRGSSWPRVEPGFPVV